MPPSSGRLRRAILQRKPAQYQSGHRHQWLLRRQRHGRPVAVYPPLAACSIAQALARSTFRRNLEPAHRRGRMAMLAPRRSGLRVQCDRGAVAQLSLPDPVAALLKSADGFNAERRRRIDHLEHGHRAQCRWPDRRLRAGIRN